MGFRAIPAIDLMRSRCVRLSQGKFDQVKTFENMPAEQAAIFAEAGAERLHIIDLDGAKEGASRNFKSIAAIGKVLEEKYPDVSMQVGGGLRDENAIEEMLESGVVQVTLGTSAVTDAKFLRQACFSFPNRILLALDSRQGKLAVKGWVTTTDLDVIEFAKSAEDSGVAGIIITDVDCDGMDDGPNYELTYELTQQVNVPIYAAGGIRSVQHITDIRELGIAGAIIGTALYDGNIPIKQLIHA